MCRCTPEIRTPFCGKPGCEWPPQKVHELDHELVARFIGLFTTSSDRLGTMRQFYDHPHEARAALKTIQHTLETIRASLP